MKRLNILKKIYCVECNKYRKFVTPNISCISNKTLRFYVTRFFLKKHLSQGRLNVS